MYKRIKIYSVILAVIYGLIIINGAFDFAKGFMLGVDKSKAELKTGVSSTIYHFMVEPVESKGTFPETIINQLTGEEIHVEACEYMLSIINPPSTVATTVIPLIKGLVAIIFVVLVIYALYLFFMTIRSVTKDKIIDGAVIKKIRKIGWIIVAMFVYQAVVYIVDYCIVKDILKMENYKIIMDYSSYSTLVLGIVTLLLAEILKVSLFLKEEQDLTI